MYTKYVEALESRKSTPFIHEIFDEIQKELQAEKCQLPECIWNDNTRYLVFKKRNKNVGAKFHKIEMADQGNKKETAQTKTAGKAEDDTEIVYGGGDTGA